MAFGSNGSTANATADIADADADDATAADDSDTDDDEADITGDVMLLLQLIQNFRCSDANTC